MPRTPHISPLSLRPLTLAVALLLLCLNSCAPIREAQQVVAEADSLRTAGVPYADSTTMADAAATLEQVRLIYPTAYAHANYYYGRILREAGNQPEAMLAFLRVVHSRTKDYAIKGRAYSNMGTMCHLTDDYGLAYNMYSLSANQFLMNDDSLLYFYSLNNMAYELAEQGDKSGVYDLLAKVESQCLNEDVLTKVIETKAEACIKVNENDSALYYSIMLWERGNHEPTGLLIRAQAYDNLGEKDSALLYANLLLESSDFYGDRFNALYILTHNDTTINVEEVLSLTSDRTDIQMDYTEVRATLSQATQLLEQDLNRKPDLKWLLAVLVTLAVIGATLSMYIKRKRRKRQLISQQVDNLRQEQAALSSQTQHLKSVNIECEEQVKHNITLFCQKVLLNPNPQEVISWDNYKQMRAIINENFFGLADKLEDLGLADHEVRFCVLVLLRFNRKKSAEWMRLGVASIGGKKRDIAMKLGQKSAHLYDFLLSLALK